MRAVVFGGSGFVGKHLVPRLTEVCTRIVVAGRTKAPGTGTTEHRPCDVADGTAVRKLLDDIHPQIVINLASVTRGSTEAMCRTNVLGCLNLLEAVKDAPEEVHFITFGSAAEYGDTPCKGEPIAEDAPCRPVGVYGATKLAATTASLGLAVRFGVRVCVLRPFNIIGAGCPESLLTGAVIARVKTALGRTGEHEIAVGRTDTRRDFVAVEDVVDAVLAIVRARPPSGILNICSGVPLPIAELLATLREVAGQPFSWRTDDSLVRPDDPLVSYGTHARLTAATGFRPRVPLARSLRAAWLHAMSGDDSPQVSS